MTAVPAETIPSRPRSERSPNTRESMAFSMPAIPQLPQCTATAAAIRAKASTARRRGDSRMARAPISHATAMSCKRARLESDAPLLDRHEREADHEQPTGAPQGGADADHAGPEAERGARRDQERRENEVGEVDARPGHVLELGRCVPGVPGHVDEHHEDDGDAAQHVDRHRPPWLLWCAGGSILRGGPGRDSGSAAASTVGTPPAYGRDLACQKGR